MAKRGRPKKEISEAKSNYVMGPITFTGKRHTLEETAKALGMTRQGVLAVEKRALAKLKAGLAKYGITKFEDVFDERMFGATSDEYAIFNTVNS